jgi:alkylated DNA repair dioxygenase AlkB
LRYPDGATHIKRHRDREVPAGSTIAGISVDETRTLVLSTWKKDVKSLSLELKPGSSYAFLPPTNERSFHAIEAEPDKKGARVSFTFRTNWRSDDGDTA